MRLCVCVQARINIPFNSIPSRLEKKEHNKFDNDIQFRVVTLITVNEIVRWPQINPRIFNS